MKKIVALTAGLLCSAMLFAGGGAQQQPAASSGPDKLSVTIMDDIRIENYKTTLQTKMIEKDCNVDLTFNVLPGPATDYNNRINLMVMAGGNELTDMVVVQPGDAVIYSWAQEGAIVPLTKYLNDEKIMPNLHDGFNRIGRNFLSDVTSPDGELYGFPNITNSYYDEFDNKYMYYKPWADKLNLTFPTTTADYPAFLKAIANGDPNGNGKKDEIPLTGMFNFSGVTDFGRWFYWLMNSFVYAGDPYLFTVTDGKVGAAYNTDEWRQGLNFIRGLFADGLIPPETLTQDDPQMRTLLNQDGPQVFSFVWYNADAIAAGNPYAEGYTAALPLKGPNGVQYAKYLPLAVNLGMVVSKNCKNVSAAVRVADYMDSEYQAIMARFGEEGVNWDYAKNIPNAENLYDPTIPGWPLSIISYEDKAPFWSGTNVTNASWRQKGTWVRGYNIVNGTGLPKGVPTGRAGINANIAIMYQTQAVRPQQIIPKLIFNSDEIMQFNEIWTNMQNYLTSTTAAFLLGSQNIDAGWNSYLAELNNIGLQKLLTITQTVYDRMYK